MSPGANRATRIAAGTVVVALGTWWLGWTVAPIWGALVGFAQPNRRPARAAAMSAGLGWALVLVVLALTGKPVSLLASKLSLAMGIPEWALFAATLLFPAVLAASAAWMMAVLRVGPESATGKSTMPQLAANE